MRGRETQSVSNERTLNLRRSDRDITGLSNILKILDECEVVRIALCSGNRPYIVPMNFAYETEGEKLFIYLHCAPTGKKLDMIAKNNNVCFEADCLYKTLKAETACHWSAEFQSVIGEGKIDIITDKTQKTAALDLLMKRYGFEGKPDYPPQAIAAVIIMRISVSSITGKSNMKG